MDAAAAAAAAADAVVANGVLAKLEEEREAQKRYWEEHSRDLTVEAMMLDSRAADLDKEERPEILSLLPSYEGKSVLELGAGIGRFTRELATTPEHVLAMDFIECVIKKNESINGHYENATFMCTDVRSPYLVIEDNSIDLIFSNWLLMYLSDKEVEKLVERMVKWLKVGGHIFFRESCFHQSGDSKKKVNPTHYREPRFYTMDDLKHPEEIEDRSGGGNMKLRLSLMLCVINKSLCFSCNLCRTMLMCDYALVGPFCCAPAFVDLFCCALVGPEIFMCRGVDG